MLIFNTVTVVIKYTHSSYTQQLIMSNIQDILTVEITFSTNCDTTTLAKTLIKLHNMQVHVLANPLNIFASP